MARTLLTRFRFSRRSLLKTTALTGGGLVTGATLGELAVQAAQSAHAAPASSTTFQAPPVGAWTYTVTFPDGTQEPSLGTFSADGTMAETNAKTLYPGYGIWQLTGGNTFRYTFREQLFDSQNNLIGEVHVRQSGTFTKNTFDVTGTGTLHDMNGNILGQNNTSTHGDRITFDQP